MPEINKAVPYYLFALSSVLKNKSLRTERAAAHQVLSEWPVSQSWKHSLMVKLAVAHAHKRGWIKLIRDEFADPWFQNESIAFDENDPGIVEVSRKYKAVGNAGPQWLMSAFDNICRSFSEATIRTALRELEEPTSEGATSDDQLDYGDDEWAPIALNRDDPLYAEAVEATDAAIEVVQGNNGYATSEPDERNAVVATMRGTIDAIKNGMPSAAAIRAGLLSPLKHLAKKFADTAIGLASKVAVEKLVAWLATLL